MTLIINDSVNNLLKDNMYYFQPCNHCSVSFKSCQLISAVRCEIIASNKHRITSPSSSKSTSEIKKCFSLLIGLTAVHLLRSSFLGLILLIANTPKMLKNNMIDQINNTRFMNNEIRPNKKIEQKKIINIKKGNT